MAILFINKIEKWNLVIFPCVIIYVFATTINSAEVLIISLFFFFSEV